MSLISHSPTMQTHATDLSRNLKKESIIHMHERDDISFEYENTNIMWKKKRLFLSLKFQGRMILDNSIFVKTSINGFSFGRITEVQKISDIINAR